MPGFNGKWLRAGAPTNAPLIGSVDIQLPADLGNSNCDYLSAER